MRDEERRQPALTGTEAELLSAFLDFHRDTLRWKVDGLTREQMLVTHPPSEMTLLGLVRHLAYVEDYWFTQVFAGAASPEPWASADWTADRDWEWHSTGESTVEESLGLWNAAVARSVAASRGRALDELSVAGHGRAGERVSLRWILLHLVEEYARHNGHADLIREAIDGVTGE